MVSGCTWRCGTPLARQYLLIDGLSAFYEAHDHAGIGRLSQIVQRLIREGRQFGIHVVAATTRRQDVGTGFSRAFSRWLILRQGSIDDYRTLEVPSDVLSEDGPPGRVLLGRSEGQLAVLGGSRSGDVQARAIESFGTQLRERGATPADPVRTLPPVLAHSSVDAEAFYMDDDELRTHPFPTGVDLLQIAGPRGSGKSTGLWRAASCLSASFVSIDLFTAKPAALNPGDAWRVWEPSTDGAGARLQELATGEAQRLVLIDDLGPLTDSMISMQIEELIRFARSPGLTILLTIENVDARASFKPVIREVRSHRSSLLLQPDALADGEIAGADLPRVKTHGWPPGRGFHVAGNSTRLVQLVSLPGTFARG